MALDVYSEIWNKVKLRCPAASSLLCRDWVNNAFRQVSERLRWSRLLKRGQFIMPAVYNTGTVSVTHDSTAVVGTGTTFTSAMVGRQFRVSTDTPIYTVSTFTDTTNLVLDQSYGGDTDTSASYEIYQAYVTAPADFHAFKSVWDPKRNWQLYLSLTQEDLNSYDARRSSGGSSAWAVVPYLYDTTSSPPLPRFELWPHQKTQYVYPFLYEARLSDLEDSGSELPRYIRGDVLLEMALAEAARFPGTDSRPNLYYNLKLSILHEQRVEKMVVVMERQDDEVYEQDIYYQTQDYPPVPWASASWIQDHALG